MLWRAPPEMPMTDSLTGQTENMVFSSSQKTNYTHLTPTSLHLWLESRLFYIARKAVHRKESGIF